MRRAAAALVSIGGGVLVLCYLVHSGLVGRATSASDATAEPASAAAETPTPCDRQAAQDVMQTVRSYAGWSIVGDHVAVTWHTKSHVLPPKERPQWTRSFAAADACLTGETRRIQFYADGELVALSAPTSGIWIME